MKKLVAILIMLFVIFNVFSTCFATKVNNDVTKTSSISTNDNVVVTPKTGAENVNTKNDVVVINDTSETRPVDVYTETMVDDVNTSTMDNGKVWTVTLAIVAILIIVIICIYMLFKQDTKKQS